MFQKKKFLPRMTYLGSRGMTAPSQHIEDGGFASIRLNSECPSTSPPISKKMLLCCFSDHERWVLALGGGNDSIFPTDGGILFVSSRSSRSSFMTLSCRQLTQATSSALEYPSTICWQYGLYFWLSMTHEDTNLAFFSRDALGSFGFGRLK